jgi:hypothetical protein
MGYGNSMRNKSFKHHISGLLLVSSLFLIDSGAALSQSLVIQPYAVKLRQSPALLGPSVGELKHGDIVQEVSRQGNFVKVKNKNLNGWIPISAITEEKKFALKKGSKVESKDNTVVAAAALGLTDGDGDIDTSKAKQSKGRSRLRDVEEGTPDNEADVAKFKSDGELKSGKKGASR